MTAATPTWTESERRTVAALLDLVWSMPGYERLVGAWDFDGDDATRAITWLMSLLTDTIDDDAPPPVPRAAPGGRAYHHGVSDPVGVPRRSRGRTIAE